MKRRTFLKTGAALGAAAAAGLPQKLFSQTDKQMPDFNSFYGVNLIEKFWGFGPRRRFDEEDFEIMKDFGFNFARIPMSYWTWTDRENWMNINEEIFEDIDEVIEFGRQYDIHINLNLHRIPGYCINGRDKEPVDLFEDTPKNMEKAQKAAVYHWRYIAERYAGIPNSRLTFDLINEPPKMETEDRYIEVIKALVGAIKEEDPGRIIVADGKDVGRTPVFGVTDFTYAQSTRGYDPMSISHFNAHWPPDDDFETTGPISWPLTDDSGQVWDKAYLKKRLIDPWKKLEAQGVQVHVGEWGVWKQTPHDLALRWMEDLLQLWQDAGWGNALWNLKGEFGVLNSERTDITYENYKGHKLDRKMLELLQQYRG